MGGEWFSDSLSMADMKDKTAAEKLQGYWVLEIGELTGLKKIEVEAVKSFLSSTARCLQAGIWTQDGRASQTVHHSWEYEY